MNYLPNSPTTQPDLAREPLAGDGGIGFKPVARTDLSDWIELMEVVEALCPVWPVRRRAVVGEFRL